MQSFRGKFLLVAIIIGIALGVGGSGVGRAAFAAPLKGAFVTPKAGQHIYDQTGLLTKQEISELEQHAATVEKNGAAIIVYLQVKDADFPTTLQDANTLMNAWDVETRPHAYDGVVMLLNLQPGNERHGQVAIYAGKNLLNGNLPQSEIQRIYQDVMLPQLAAGATAQGIAEGLDAISQDLLAGPPALVPVSALTQFARWPMNLIIFFLTGTILGLCIWQQHRLVRHVPIVPTLQPPDEVSPALVGAK